jgi:butyrate kinase
MFVLAINPGSTSTKFSVFNDKELVFENVIRHSNEELSKYNNIIEQNEFRYLLIREEIIKKGINLEQLSAIVGRGGLLHPLEGGTYLVNEDMLQDLREGKYGEHASNLGALIADRFAQELKIPAYIVDPVVVDEMNDVSRISGNPLFERVSILHALNQKAVARLAAEKIEKKYNESNMIVVHLGGGISVGLHVKGKVVDVNNALDGEGPFTPERSGSLPAGALAALCFSGEYTLDQVKKLIKGQGGLVAYLGTNDGREIVSMIENGDTNAYLIYKAMAYQIGKEIGSLAAANGGNIDAIVISGGLAYDKDYLMPWISEMVSFIAPIIIYPGEKEMQALNEGAIRVLKEEEGAKHYKKDE